MPVIFSADYGNDNTTLGITINDPSSTSPTGMYEGEDTYNLFNNTLAPKLNEAIEQISHTAVRLHKSESSEEYKLELLENYCESFDEATLPLIP